MATRNVLALIPARGGSQGVVRKNLAMIHGRPLVEWTIRAALGARRVTAVYLSSDDDEILEVGGRLGVECLRRPAAAATDEAPATDVVKHFLSTLNPKERDANPYIVYLQPTSPLRTATHIDAAIESARAAGVDRLISVFELENSPFKAFVLSDGLLQPLFGGMSNHRRQDLPRTFMPNGAIYLFSVSAFNEFDGFPNRDNLPFLMDRIDSIDIDDSADLRLAEELLEQRHG